MDETKKKELYKDLIGTWGETSQLRICVEEMSELTKEICKYLRFKDNSENLETTKKNVIEEAADVIICVEQIKCLFGEDKVDEMIDYKLKRVSKRLDEYKKNHNK